MGQIERTAEISVARGCGFAMIAIVTLMVGLSADVKTALLAGGYLSLMTCLVLAMRGWGSKRRPYKRTEVWVMLLPEERPPPGVAQRVIGSALRDAYLTYAMRAATFGAVLLSLALVYGIALPRPA
jgi:hypothetical protein